MVNMSRSTRSARAVAVVAAILCGAVATSAPKAVHAAAPDPCAPFGSLAELKLNDRCDFNTADASAVVGALAKGGLFATEVPCRNGTTAAVVARPNDLLVTSDTPLALVTGLVALRERIGNVIVAVLPLNALAAVVRVLPGTIDVNFLRVTIPQLQGPTWSTDLNYLEPVQPNNGFHPGDDPVEAPAPETFGTAGRGRVLVVDSPSQPGAHPMEPDVVTSSLGPPTVYDAGGNNLVDEDHAHGTYVASLVKRLAPGADVVLAGVNGRQLPRSARWSPMMFSDADLIATLDAAFGLSPLGRTTRRTFDVVNLSLGGAGCADRNGQVVGVRLALGRFMRDLAAIASQRGAWPMYVAAAGNDGADVKHFPAAFRDEETMEAAALAIDAAVGLAAGKAVRQLQDDFAEGMVAVGSWTEGARDPFSNCGVWINAVADGAGETSRYPSPSTTTWANWSGTSFATPRVTAALVEGADLKDVMMDDAVVDVGGC